MSENAETISTDYLEFAADIVAAYVSNNSIPVSELPSLIAGVHTALAGLSNGAAQTDDAKVEKQTPAQIKKSITSDALISFEDGKPYKTLRRHLTLRGLTPEAYRAKHGLPADYPMTSASYSAQRSELARSLGLGQQRRKAAAKDVAADETVSSASKPKPARKIVAADKAAEAPKPAKRRKGAQVTPA